MQIYLRLRSKLLGVIALLDELGFTELINPAGAFALFVGRDNSSSFPNVRAVFA